MCKNKIIPKGGSASLELLQVCAMPEASDLRADSLLNEKDGATSLPQKHIQCARTVRNVLCLIESDCGLGAEF